jgi:hypothetical protein
MPDTIGAARSRTPTDESSASEVSDAAFFGVTPRPVREEPFMVGTPLEGLPAASQAVRLDDEQRTAEDLADRTTNQVMAPMASDRKTARALFTEDGSTLLASLRDEPVHVRSEADGNTREAWTEPGHALRQQAGNPKEDNRVTHVKGDVDAARRYRDRVVQHAHEEPEPHPVSAATEYVFGPADLWDTVDQELIRGLSPEQVNAALQPLASAAADRVVAALERTSAQNPSARVVFVNGGAANLTIVLAATAQRTANQLQQRVFVKLVGETLVAVCASETDRHPTHLEPQVAGPSVMSRPAKRGKPM